MFRTIKERLSGVILNVKPPQTPEGIEYKCELLHMVYAGLEALERDSGDDRYCLPNGTMIRYDEVKKAVRKYLIVEGNK
jgi:hypothetical protein